VLNVECGHSFANTPTLSKMVHMYLSQKSDFLTLHMNNYKKTLTRYSKMRKLLLKLLWLYQKFFTLIGFGSCRYYPTCSEFARINFENNSISSAFYHSFTRILRCNQFFEGGIEYPLLDKLVLKPKKLKLDSIKYWLVPNKKNQHYIIKNFSYKG
jgi:uncharacterized protein